MIGSHMITKFYVEKFSTPSPLRWDAARQTKKFCDGLPKEWMLQYAYLPAL